MGKKQKDEDSSDGDSYQDMEDPTWGGNKNTYYAEEGDKDYSDYEEEREEAERTLMKKNLAMDEDAFGGFDDEGSEGMRDGSDEEASDLGEEEEEED
jgi:hypothetical protein